MFTKTKTERTDILTVTFDHRETYDGQFCRFRHKI